MFCTECGTENRNDRKFCTNCGKPLRDYTKPRENLLMPEDITKAQEKVKAKKALANAFNVAIVISLLLAVACAIAIFFTTEVAKTVFVCTSCVLFVLTLVFIIIKSTNINKDK